MYRKEDILHKKFYKCLNIHRFHLSQDSETKKGYRYIAYIIFLNSEYSFLKRYKENKEKIRLRNEVMEVMNLACNKYLELQGGY